MKISRPILVLSSLSLLGAVAAISAACTASVTTPGLTSYSAGFSGACSGSTYEVLTDYSGLCGGDSVYVTCDGTAWSDGYYCDSTDLPTGYTPVTATTTVPIGDGGPSLEAGSDSGPTSEASTGDTGTGPDAGGDTGPTAEAGSGDGGSSEASTSEEAGQSDAGASADAGGD